ncbi:MAG: Gfo/Idh/MocA family oxidoreductase [Verrucomicrobiota bacterium]
MNRRRFIKSTSAATAGLGLSTAPFILAQKAPFQYRVALIGSGWWGMNILRVALETGRCKAVALCDVDADALEISAEEVNDLAGTKPNTYPDFRELFANEEIDIAIIATPDHWHALPAIEAINAGAHVFLEKPTGHTIRESRSILNAARAADRKVQVGLHRRIGPHHVSGMDFLRSGKVGDIGMVRSFVFNGGGEELPSPNSEPPNSLDWEFYCGPAPLRPFNRKIHPGGFRNFLDFANGTLGDWGIHWLDQVLWWTDEKYPKSVYSTGGRPVKGPAILNDKEQTSDAPDSQVAVFEFESFTATWEHRRFAQNPTEKHKVGTYFYGSNGIFHMGWRDGWTFYPADQKKQIIHEDPNFDDEKAGHNIPGLWTDFFDAIENDRLPVADIEPAHLSTNLSLLGMLSLKHGKSVAWDGSSESIIGDDAANALLQRTYRGPWEYPVI